MHSRRTPNAGACPVPPTDVAPWRGQALRWRQQCDTALEQCCRSLVVMPSHTGVWAARVAYDAAVFALGGRMGGEGHAMCTPRGWGGGACATGARRATTTVSTPHHTRWECASAPRASLLCGLQPRVTHTTRRIMRMRSALKGMPTPMANHLRRRPLLHTCVAHMLCVCRRARTAAHGGLSPHKTRAMTTAHWP